MDTRIIKLPAYVGMLEIIRQVYQQIDTKGTIMPIDKENVPCDGVGSRFYNYSLIFTPNAWAPGVHDADITFISKITGEKLVNIRVRIETNIHEIYINVKWEALDWLSIAKETLESFFLDYPISANIRPEITTT